METANILERGVVRVPSNYSVSDTLDRLSVLLQAKGISVFARIDFSADAKRAGLPLRPVQLLLFGNPKGGTPLLAAKPGVGLDLPFKVLAYEDAEGKVWVTYNDPAYIVGRHGVDSSLAANLAALVPLISKSIAD